MFNPDKYKDTPTQDEESDNEENEDESEKRSGSISLHQPSSQEQWSQTKSLSTSAATKNRSIDEVGFWNTHTQNRSSDPFAGAPVLKKSPVWVEPSTTIVSNKNPSDVYKALTEALDAYDIEANETNSKIRGLVYTPSRCSFAVNMFEGDDSTLVEFQRRSGCALSFNSMFNDALSALAPIITRLYSSQVPFEIDPCRDRAPKPLLCSMLDVFPPCTDEEFDETLQGFCAMLEDPFFESQQEVGCSLMDWLQCDSNVERLQMDHLLKLGNLVNSSLLASGHHELLHSGSVSMDLLLQIALQRNEITNGLVGLVPAMVSIIRSPDVLENRDTKRHVTSGLKTLASNSTIASQLVQCKGDLQLYQRSSDARIRDNVVSILDLLC